MALRSGYGTGVYTSGKYGLPEVYEGASAVSITTVVSQADGQRIALGATAVEDAVSHVVSAQRIQNGAVAASISASATASGYIALAGAAAATIDTSVALYWNRVRPFSVAETAQSDNVIDARYKWLDTSIPSTSWSSQSIDAVIWADSSAGSVSWTDADYREGAA